MLVALVILSTVLNVAFSLNTSTVMMNDVISNFIIWNFEQGATYFPYSMNKCQASGLLLSTLGYKFTCAADGMSVTLEIYDDYTCSNVDPLMTMINSTGYDDGSGFKSFGYDTSMSQYRNKKGAFECNGINAYTSISFDYQQCNSVNSGQGATIYAALNVCQNSPSSATYTSGRSLMIYCDTMEARLQYWLTNQYPTCNGNITQETNYIYPTCGYAFTFGTNIYGKLNECNINGMTTTTTTPTSTNVASTTTSGGWTEEPETTRLLNLSCTQYVQLEDSPIFGLNICNHYSYNNTIYSYKFMCLDNNNDSSIMAYYYTDNNCNNENIIDQNSLKWANAYKCGDINQACSSIQVKLYDNCSNDYWEYSIVKDTCFNTNTHYGDNMIISCDNTNSITFKTYNDELCNNNMLNHTFMFSNQQCDMSPFSDMDMVMFEITTCPGATTTSTPGTTQKGSDGYYYYYSILNMFIIFIICMFVM